MAIERREPHPAQGVYGISVAADLVGMSPQTLRLYEVRGLLEPERTDGGTRRYSQDDLDQLHRIGQLLGDGLNLAGVAAVLELERVNARLRAENRRMRAKGRSAQPADAAAPEHGGPAR
jgi:MerR family transcriptional regulator/heat shock protein HspR